MATTTCRSISQHSHGDITTVSSPSNHRTCNVFAKSISVDSHLPRTIRSLFIATHPPPVRPRGTPLARRPSRPSPRLPPAHAPTRPPPPSATTTTARSPRARPFPPPPPAPAVPPRTRPASAARLSRRCPPRAPARTARRRPPRPSGHTPPSPSPASSRSPTETPSLRSPRNTSGTGTRSTRRRIQAGERVVMCGFGAGLAGAAEGLSGPRQPLGSRSWRRRWRADAGSRLSL